MDNNYRWDRSGEIDPDMQQLEETLGALRYQPQPLRIPTSLQIRRRRSFYPLMAIAAGLAALAGALTRYEGWFLIPFVTLYFLVVAKRRPLLASAVFSVLAVLGQSPAGKRNQPLWYSWLGGS